MIFCIGFGMASQLRGTVAGLLFLPAVFDSLWKIDQIDDQ